MKKEIEKLKKEMLDSYKELEDFKNKNSTKSDNFFTELNITTENHKEYDRLLGKVNDSRIKFETENVNFLYINVVSNCKFISKKDSWFVEYKECVLDDKNPYSKYKRGDKFNKNYGLFYGLTMETFEGYLGELPREDGKTCTFDEFYIYDGFGNEISELTLEEYEVLIKSKQK